MNKVEFSTKKQIEKQIKLESSLAKDESMKVLKEFEAISIENLTFLN